MMVSVLFFCCPPYFDTPRASFAVRQVLYERYEAQPELSRRTMKARLLWDAMLESQVCWSCP